MRFPNAELTVEHDLLAAARALCQDQKGIATILGTGSNSCLYDGERIVRSHGGTGYILGDEGSGADMGKRLARAILDRDLPAFLIERFYHAYELNEEELIEGIYRQPGANRFLASFAPFLKENIEEAPIEALVEHSFRAFITEHILQYEEHRDLPMNSVGAIGVHFRVQLERIAGEYGISTGKVSDEPIHGLVQYHTKDPDT